MGHFFISKRYLEVFILPYFVKSWIEEYQVVSYFSQQDEMKDLHFKERTVILFRACGLKNEANQIKASHFVLFKVLSVNCMTPLSSYLVFMTHRAACVWCEYPLSLALSFSNFFFVSAFQKLKTKTPDYATISSFFLTEGLWIAKRLTAYHISAKAILLRLGIGVICSLWLPVNSLEMGK